MIGGEFEIDLSTRSDSFVPAPDTYYYASGRAALYQILKAVKSSQHKIWLPDYLCHTIVDAVKKAGWEYDFYELSMDLEATITALDEKGFQDGCVVLIINYFGLQDLTGSAGKIKESFPHSIIVEDDVQAFFCFSEDENPYADFRFTSLRKALPVPDGGLVYTKKQMAMPCQPNTFAEFKIRGGVMKMNRGRDGIRDEDYLKLFEEGARLIDENYESEMSPESKSLFAGIHTSFVKERRKANSTCLLSGLKEIGISPILDFSADKVPLFIPIHLENRDEVRRRLFQHEMFCPVHWPLEGLPIKRGAEMAKHEISLIVDQRYNENDIKQIVSLINYDYEH